MATTDSNKSNESSSGGNKNSRSRTSKSGSKSSSSSTKRNASRSNGSNGNNGSKRGSGNRGGNRRSGGNSNSNNLIPYLSSTAASLIGAGIAIGIGLFATRRQWMPYTEEFNEYLQDRWENLSSSSDDDYDDDEDFDRWPAGEDPAPATFPGDGIRPAA